MIKRTQTEKAVQVPHPHRVSWSFKTFVLREDMPALPPDSNLFMTICAYLAIRLDFAADYQAPGLDLSQIPASV